MTNADGSMNEQAWEEYVEMLRWSFEEYLGDDFNADEFYAAMIMERYAMEFWLQFNSAHYDWEDPDTQDLVWDEMLEYMYDAAKSDKNYKVKNFDSDYAAWVAYYEYDSYRQ